VHERLSAGKPPRGALQLSRWTEAAPPPRRPERRPEITEHPGFFVYGQAASYGSMHWHLNFAMSDCFGAYAGRLLAQDELQVLEHPVLASLREAANVEGFSLLCVERGRPTPVLVCGAERRGALDTAPARERPQGLYGNAFAGAPTAQVLAALTVLEPPQVSNIVAIEAPAYGSGPYHREEVELILCTAYSGFRAAVLETRRAVATTAPTSRTVIHTGFWGAGAYGGDHELMALLQLLAAELAGVDELVFYTARDDGPEALDEARRRYEALPSGASAEELVRRVLALGYVWGVSNGT
jgi:hypothetical protein